MGCLARAGTALRDGTTPAEAGAQLGDGDNEAMRAITTTLPTGPRPSPGWRKGGSGGLGGPVFSILPRQGEVAPQVTEGEGSGTAVTPFLPLRLASASHLPLAGEDRYGRLTS